MRADELEQLQVGAAERHPLSTFDDFAGQLWRPRSRGRSAVSAQVEAKRTSATELGLNA